MSSKTSADPETMNWQTAFDAVEEAICLVDLQGRIWLSNHAMAEFLHRSKEDLVGKSCFGVVHGTDCPIHDCPVVRMAKSRKREILVLEQDGGCYEAIADPYYDKSGELIGAVHILSDITPRRQAEMEAARLRQELFHLSRVSAMGELAATLAHELNQPLTAILANAQAIQQLLGKTGPDIEAGLSDIISENRRAAEIIRRIRAMVTKQAPAFTPVDMNGVVRNVQALIQGLALARNIAVELRLSPDLPLVSGDPVQLQQVMLNLMLNAIEAISLAGIRPRKLTVRTTPAGPGGAQVAVEDTGPGLPTETDAQLFATFYTTKSEGMGMGLPICRSILQHHGGRIWAEPRPGGGAVFRFELPPPGRPCP